MWHVTDGDLHAYLDGALDLHAAADAQRVRSHLEACEECRGRLEDEERVREAAAEVLARTGPASVDVPPFEELRRRSAVAGGASAGRPRRGPGLGLGWAASVLLALGVGWMVGQEAGARNGGLAQAEPSAPAAEAEGVRRRASSGVAPVRASGEEAPGEEGSVEARLADAATTGTGEAGTTPGERVVGVRSAKEAQAAGAPAEPLARAETAAAVATFPEEDAPAAPGRALAAPRQAVADSTSTPGTVVGRAVREGTDSPLVGAQVTVAGTALGSVTDEQGRYVLSAVPTGDRTLRLRLIGHETVSERVTVAAGDTAVVDLSSPVAAVALDNIVVSGAARRDAVTPRAEPGASARTLAIPGLEVLRVSWTEVAPGVEGLAVEQRLVGDTTRLELRFGGLDREGGRRSGELGAAADEVPEALLEELDAAADEVPEALLEESLPEGVNQVSSPLPRGGWVVLRGRLPTERLGRLLDLVR